LPFFFIASSKKFYKIKERNAGNFGI